MIACDLNKAPSANAEFNLWDRLYTLRTRAARPGRPCPFQDTDDPTNVQRFEQWMASGQALKDLITFALYLETEHYELTRTIESLYDDLDLAHAATDQLRMRTAP